MGSIGELRLVPAFHEPERRPPARRSIAAILERAVPEAGAPMLWRAKDSGSSLPGEEVRVKGKRTACAAWLEFISATVELNKPPSGVGSSRP